MRRGHTRLVAAHHCHHNGVDDPVHPPRKLIATAAALAASLVLGLAPAAPSAAEAEWAALAHEIGKPWPALQRSDGELVDYMDEYTNPTGKPGGTRYGDALMGYALVQTGLRAKDRALIETGIRSLSWATNPDRVFPPTARSDDSVFEQWGVAAAYNLARKKLNDDPFWEGEGHRRRWETWLRQQKTVRFGTGRRFSNHDLVEAVMVLELMDSGLDSDVPNAVVGAGRGQAERQLKILVNETAPRVVGDRNPAFISDPPDMPAAYHALSFGLYAHLVARLDDRATKAARIVARRAADGSWRMAAPDADQGLWGRSQELVWLYPAAAYGAAVAAGLPDTSLVDAARYRAVANRSLARLRSHYPVTAKGQLVSPGLGTDTVMAAYVLEGYVGAPSMGGLALVFLNLALDEPAASLDGRVGKLASDIDTEAVIGDGAGSFGVARRGNIWYAVRASRLRAGRLGSDVRYDLGVVGAKRFENGAWRDLVAHRPNTMAQKRGSRWVIDSMGPLRVAPGRRMYAGAPRTVEVAGDGGFVLRGGYYLNKNVRARRANFLYRPTRCGVAFTFPGNPREVFELSQFFRAGPTKSGRVLATKHERVTASVPFTYRLVQRYGRARHQRYASSMHAPLYRAHMRLRMPASGRITIESC
jgi:hypothetical protein